jgi:hypothetical protein
VVFGDLAAEDEADAGAFGLRGEKRHEEIGRLRDAGAVVFDEDFYGVGGAGGEAAPGNAGGGGGFALGALLERGLDGVFDQVDEDLFDLRGVAGERERGAAEQLDREAAFEGDDALDERGEFAGGDGGLTGAGRGARRPA